MVCGLSEKERCFVSIYAFCGNTNQNFRNWIAQVEAARLFLLM